MTKVLLSGIGGYGETYVNALLDNPLRDDIEIAGIVDPFAEKSKRFQDLVSRGVKRFDSVDDFFDSERADLTIISTPIQFHARQTVRALRGGSSVLLEKPMAGSSDECRAMIKERDASGRFLNIGFQWCYNPAMLAAKKDFESGAFGKALRFRALVLWPRTLAYYKRGCGWAGKKFDGEGRPVFDSVAANATAHYLMNMLWFGGRGYGGMNIVSVNAETARANDIETYDTIALKAVDDEGCEIFFGASHAVGKNEKQDPMFEYEFENGILSFGGFGVSGCDYVFTAKNGETKKYASPNPWWYDREKLWHSIDMLRDTGIVSPCPAEAAMKHTLLIEKAYAVAGESREFAPGRVKEINGSLVADGLGAEMVDRYLNRRVRT